MTTTMMIGFRFGFLLLLLLFAVSVGAAAEKDMDERCQGWAEQGECGANPRYMLSNCAASCRMVKETQMRQQALLQDVDDFYDLEARTLQGQLLRFERLRGSVVVITNVASECGYTESHYRGLVELWSNVSTENVYILAFPCNQFGNQEPGSPTEIQAFANEKGVEFTMMEKIDVNGPHTSVVYLYLKDKARTPQGGSMQSITWNFATYFVVSPDGKTITAYNGVEPMDLLQDPIMKLLGKEEL